MSNPRSNVVAISQPRTPVVCVGEAAAAGESHPSVRLAAWATVVGCTALSVVSDVCCRCDAGRDAGGRGGL